MKAAQAETGRPSLIIARTHIAMFAPTKQDSSSSHGSPLGQEEIDKTKERIGWPVEPKFYVPDEVYANYQTLLADGQKREAEWQKRFDAWAAAYPDLAAEWKMIMAGELPAGWDQDLPKYAAKDGGSRDPRRVRAR